MIRRITQSLLLSTVFLVLLTNQLVAQDGYKMWLSYDLVQDSDLLTDYRDQFRAVHISDDSPRLSVAGEELTRGLSGLLGEDIQRVTGAQEGLVVAGTPQSSGIISELNLDDSLSEIGPEGYVVERRDWNGSRITVIAGNEDIGVLYGVFAFLREIQTNQSPDRIELMSAPKVEFRVVNHWDNLDRLVERGYAGLSLWDWGTLPQYKDPRYTDYARINASVGINAAAINNVNADPEILTEQFLEKVAALSDIFRPYGIQVFLSVRFNSPVDIGGLDTADPLDPEVAEWWKEKTDEIYDWIPDFGGFLVKADSEGQPGPHGYGRTHAEGANMLANALAPHGGVVFWRAFVYDPAQSDRFREAYDEFVPLDTEFADNVILQVKNGPIDFQPREPFSPLFGAMEQTNTMIELQVTQEYFGFNLHLAYMGPLFTEALQADTYAKGEGSTVARVIDGSVFDYERTGMAGVINPGTDRNWTGHPFVQSSWYAYGRLAWDHSLTAETIADEWIRMTYSNEPAFVEPVKEMMMMSRETGVNYRMPLGLTHLYAQGHHYGPAPWTSDLPRPDWTAVYYHKATENGVGFDRTESGSNAVEQYHEPVARKFRDLNEIQDDYLLWFHHVGWDHTMSTGRTLWNELVHKYYSGVEQVRDMQQLWSSAKDHISMEQFTHVESLLQIQERDAIHWRNACILYFQDVNKLPLPDGYEEPDHDLQYYKDFENSKYVPDPWYN